MTRQKLIGILRKAGKTAARVSGLRCITPGFRLRELHDEFIVTYEATRCKFLHAEDRDVMLKEYQQLFANNGIPAEIVRDQIRIKK